MNHREPPQPTAGVRKAMLCLAPLLLPALAPAGVLPWMRRSAAPMPDQSGYLQAMAAPALRFQTPPPPREQVTVIIFPKPEPKPVIDPDAEQAAADAAAAKDAEPETHTTPPTDAKPKPAAPPTRAPQKIIPDDSRPAVHPEDFIPFFQLPGASRSPGEVNVIVPAPRSAPAPAPIPESSATYRQTP